MGNTRLFIHAIQIAVRTVAGDTTTSVYVSGGAFDGAAMNLGYCPVVPGVASSQVTFLYPDVLLDRACNVSLAYDAIPTYVRVTFVYARIPDVS
jgi:hypothetical protein